MSIDPLLWRSRVLSVLDSRIQLLFEPSGNEQRETNTGRRTTEVEQRKSNNVTLVVFEPLTSSSGKSVARAASAERGTNLRDNLCFNLFETSDLNSHAERGAHIFQW